MIFRFLVSFHRTLINFGGSLNWVYRNLDRVVVGKTNATI